VARRRPAWVEGRSDRLADWAGFAGWVVLAIPAAAAVVGAPATVLTTGGPVTVDALLTAGRTWYVADAMALSVVVPVILRLRPSRLGHLRPRRQALAAGGLLALAAAMSAVAFSVDGPLALSLLPLPLVLLLFRAGSAGLAAGMAVLAPIALVATRAGWGPMAAVSPGDTTGALLACQLFLVGVFTTLVVVAAMGDERQRRAAMDAANADVYRIIATTSGDLITVSESDGYVRYVSPAVDDVLGHPASALAGFGWHELLHEEDHPDVTRVLASVGRDEPHRFTFRMRRGDGTWRWFDARIRQSDGLDGAGAPLVVGTFRDVTDVRDREEGLLARTAELDALARTDPLTGLANRRELDERLAAAWRTSVRRSEPLGLLIVDVDRFKAYNDRHGHLAGDRCLARVAAAVTTAAHRPDDTCGRYGGEEFVVVLPGTDLDGAARVGERVRAAVAARASADDGVGTPVTVSVGAASCRPGDGAHLDRLFAAADTALFAAKDAGRDTVVALATPRPATADDLARR
jgi:diguanylate cyclase (GGDEF)-like protein/PAS domain S-box-containing protein